eukprot:GHVU01038207.1.p4 GENE.GHVU01038207.1~~GHVU01038207.1.p4  ORF type:complete len:114 (+),score=34.33 GHVU01038207.1:453-794(+)
MGVAAAAVVVPVTAAVMPAAAVAHAVQSVGATAGSCGSEQRGLSHSPARHACTVGGQGSAVEAAARVGPAPPPPASPPHADAHPPSSSSSASSSSFFSSSSSSSSSSRRRTRA